MANRATYFSPSEAQLLMEAYEEVKHRIKKKGNTATVIKQRENAWQSIADRLNAFQMICNADCLISNVVAKWPGSVHDARVFRASEVYQRLLQGEFSGVSLGDRGYGCQPFLLTPFTDPQGAQQAYNHAHARTRTKIEMTFGLLKERFQCLHKLRVSPSRACDFTVACAVLHNVACLRKERAPRVPPAMNWDNPAIFPDDAGGRLVRDQYVRNYFS